jgi:hypothetical protein
MARKSRMRATAMGLVDRPLAFGEISFWFMVLPPCEIDKKLKE